LHVRRVKEGDSLLLQKVAQGGDACEVLVNRVKCVKGKICLNKKEEEEMW